MHDATAFNDVSKFISPFDRYEKNNITPANAKVIRIANIGMMIREVIVSKSVKCCKCNILFLNCEI